MQPGDVHLRLAELDVPPSCLSALEVTLDRDERRRADAFAFAGDRRRFVARRGHLRALLGRELGCGPAMVRFSYGPHGKPAMAGSDLWFSCAHSGGLALIAWSHRRRVGVDLEAVRAVPDLDAIAAEHFSAREQAALDGHVGNRRLAAFLGGWTCKEAVVKATGEGLTRRLAGVEVALDPTRPAALLAVDGSAERARRWGLQRLAPVPGYVAALAVDAATAGPA